MAISEPTRVRAKTIVPVPSIALFDVEDALQLAADLSEAASGLFQGTGLELTQRRRNAISHLLFEARTAAEGAVAEWQRLLPAQPASIADDDGNGEVEPAAGDAGGEHA